MQKLGEIAEISTGFPFDGHKYTSIGIRVVRGENIGQGELHWEEKVDKRWNESTSALDNYWLYEGDIVMQMDGNVGKNIARIYTADPMLIAQRVACIRAKEKCSQDYIYGILQTKLFKNYIERCATGTSIKHISLQQISDFEFDFHLPEIQAKLGRIIADIDDKIRVNRQINDNLEAMAKQLYDYWFVQFDFPNEEGKPYKSSGGAMVYNEKLKREIPQWWSNGVLSDVANITMGQSPDGSSYNEDGEGIIFYQGSTDFGLRFPDIRQYTTSPSRYANKGDILMSVRAPVGALNIANNDCCIGRGLSALSSKIGSMTHLYYLMNDFRLKFEGMNSAGTTFGAITKDELFSLPVIIPTKSVISEFEQVCEPIFDKQMIIGEEINALTKQRDELLPLLMNGQASVNYHLSSFPHRSFGYSFAPKSTRL